MLKLLSAIVGWGVVLGSFHVSGALSAAEPSLARFESTQPQMGVPFKIILYAADQEAANAAFDAAFSRVAELNRSLSDYDPQSELSRLSRAAPTTQAIHVSDPLWLVLHRSQKLAEQTDGAFDVTVGPMCGCGAGRGAKANALDRASGRSPGRGRLSKPHAR